MNQDPSRKTFHIMALCLLIVASLLSFLYLPDPAGFLLMVAALFYANRTQRILTRVIGAPEVSTPTQRMEQKKSAA